MRRTVPPSSEIQANIDKLLSSRMVDDRILTGYPRVMMGGSTAMTIAMIVMMVAMMGGMLYGAGSAFVRRRRHRAK